MYVADAAACAASAFDIARTVNDAAHNANLAVSGNQREAERLAQVDLLRDVCGPVLYSAAKQIASDWLAWNDGTVKRLAQAIYQERSFEQMLILGDALEDAGCDDPDILRHCREPGDHVRGCWVIDLLLGKE
jgi:hypothetical protein